MNKLTSGLLGALAVTTIVFSGISAIQAQQQVRYMDSSGNIHWVDDISKVPPKYRRQVQTPTPTPVLDRRQQQEIKRRQQEEAREKRQAELDRKREIERHRKQLEQQRLREERDLRKRDDARKLN